MQIPYYTKNVYGMEKTYVKDQEIANTIQTLTGKITIDGSDMRALSALGHTFIRVFEN